MHSVARSQFNKLFWIRCSFDLWRIRLYSANSITINHTHSHTKHSHALYNMRTAASSVGYCMRVRVLSLFRVKRKTVCRRMLWFIPSYRHSHPKQKHSGAYTHSTLTQTHTHTLFERIYHFPPQVQQGERNSTTRYSSANEKKQIYIDNNSTRIICAIYGRPKTLFHSQLCTENAITYTSCTHNWVYTGKWLYYSVARGWNYYELAMFCTLSERMWVCVCAYVVFLFLVYWYCRSLNSTCCGVLSSARLLVFLTVSFAQPFFFTPPAFGVHVLERHS